MDTHVFVWLVTSRHLLTAPASEAVETRDELAVSMASIQEIAYLTARGRLTMDRPIDRWVSDALSVHSVRALAPTVSSALRAGSLDPGRFHGDPVDRLIYATAVEHDARLISADKRMREADPGRVVW